MKSQGFRACGRDKGAMKTDEVCGRDKGAMKTDEVCGRPLDPFAGRL